MSSLHAFLSSKAYVDILFVSCNCGGTVLEATSCLSSNAKARASKELEGRTGDMDSEANVDDDDEMGSNDAH